jgi:putative FmdB family regulatory protein
LPIYEYRCEDCGKTSTFVTLSVGQTVDLKCQACGGSRLRKLVSRVAIHRSEESRQERMDDPSSLGGLDENDPQAMGRWMKKMGREMGEDLGEDFDETVDRAVEEDERSGEGGEEGEDNASVGGGLDDE